MSQRVFLHVGLPKSGTTYIQAVLGKNKDLLAQRDSMLYPGETWADQVDAVRDVRRLKLPSYQRAAVAGAWDRLVAEMRDWPGDSVVSMEWLCRATPGQVARIGKDLDFAEVHVVFTARDIARTVPAAWQEFNQNRSTWRWPEFLEQVSSEDRTSTSAGQAFWGEQDLRLLLDRWAALAPGDRLHVVTVPPSSADRAELWRRTARVLGVDPVGHDLSDLGANASLGLESAELMRRVNVRLADEGLPVHAYNKVFKQKVAKEILAGRKSRESKVVLPAAYHEWAHARAEEQIAAVRASGAHLVGDLQDLRPALDGKAPTSAEAGEPSVDEVLDAAVDALVAVALQLPRGRRAQGRPPRRSTAPRESLLVRARLGVVDRLRGRSAKDVLVAARRRLHGAHGSREY